MTGDLLVGIDAGTSLIKAVAFDLRGQQLAMASRRNSYRTLANGGVEQDMERTWDNTVAVTRELGQKIEGMADRVLALGVTGQGDGTWLIDGEGMPIHDAWLWLDARAAAEAHEIATSPGMDVIYHETGTGVNLCQMRTHLRWLLRHEPELVERAATAFHCKDWLYFNLTGIRATDPTEGVFTFGDFRTREYSDPVFDALDLAGLRHLMPPILDGAVQTHPLASDAAQAVGLRAGLPVSLGYVDVICTGFGAGLHDVEVRPGLTILGSTGAHLRFVSGWDEIHLGAGRTGYTLALPGEAYAQMQTNMAATLNIDWLLGLALEVLRTEGVERSLDDLLCKLDERADAGRPGAALYHPYISNSGERGPFTEPRARASFTGLDRSTSWNDLLRGVLDGLVLAARDCYCEMGPVPSEVRISGGAARSDALRRLLGGALGAPVRVAAREEAGAAGAAMIAGMAVRVFESASAASAAWVRPLLQEPMVPDPELTATFDRLYESYRATREHCTRCGPCSGDAGGWDDDECHVGIASCFPTCEAAIVTAAGKG